MQGIVFMDSESLLGQIKADKELKRSSYHSMMIEDLVKE